MINEIEVTEIYLSLKNDREFYDQFRRPLEVASEKHFIKGNYQADRFINAMAERVRIGLKTLRYTPNFGFKMDKINRIEVAKIFENDLIGEMRLGNFHSENIKTKD